MMKIILALLIVHCSLQIAQAQWIQQFPNTPGVGFHDVKFINANTGWACGDGITGNETKKDEPEKK